MALQNRQADNLNRKKLTVVEQRTENNKTVMVVDVERADKNVTNAGTALTADNLTREIKEIVNANIGSNGGIGTTACECDYSNQLATTKFVWDVLMALGLTKISHNHGGGSGGESQT